MRLTKGDGFNIESETISSKNLTLVRRTLPKLMKTNADILIFAMQPGVGKSYTSMNFMSGISDSIFMTSKHTLLDELEKYFNQRGLENSHWFGISHARSPCTQKDTAKFQSLMRLGYNNNFICAEIMKCEECPYKEQFKETTRVLAPIHYLRTSYLKNDDYPRFSNYIIDESIMDVIEYPYDIDHILNVIRPLYFFGTGWFYEFLVSIIESKNIEGLRIFKHKIESEIKNALKTIHDLLGEDTPLETDIWGMDIKQLSKFNVDEIIKSLEFQRMYNDEINDWHEPALYKVFDMAQGAKVILLHATFNEEIFTDMLKSYSAEIGISGEINVKIFYTQIENKDTKVYNVNPKAYYPKFSLDRGGLGEVRQHIDVIGNQIGSNNVGVISFNKYNKSGTMINESFLDTGLDALHYGASAGRNILEPKKCLVIAGHFMNGGVIDMYNKLYLDRITHQDCIAKPVPNGTPYTYCPITHPKLNLVQNVLNEGEMYDAFHRNRGLIHDDRSVVAFCHIPSKIYNEFTVIESNKIQLSDWETIYKAAPVPLYELVISYFEESELTNTDIAKKLNIKNNGKFNSKLVKEMREHYEQGKKYRM